jgi:hypothetical protein
MYSDFSGKALHMLGKTMPAILLSLLLAMVSNSGHAAEREEVRKVVNLVTAVKMPFPENLTRSRARTQRVWLDLNAATVGCLRQENRRWCYEHIPPIGARAEMLRIRSEPAGGPAEGQLWHYVVDLDLDGLADVGSTTRIEGPPKAPVGNVTQFFHRANRGDKHRDEYQKMYDEGIQIALKHFGE